MFDFYHDEWLFGREIAVERAKHSPIITRATMSCANKILTSLSDENPMMSQDTIEMTLMQIKVIRRPILSNIYPDKRPPMGEKIAVIAANHDVWESLNLISKLRSFSSGSVVAG